jgi:hypothetical protein
MNKRLLDRVPRYASLLGLLGLIGMAGVFDPRFGVFSFLSFLSYLCYFRFFQWFAKPPQNVRDRIVPFLGMLPAILLPWLGSMSPMFGFIGFSGFCGLYDSTIRPQRKPAA